MAKSKERLYAESCCSQNTETLADCVRELLADEPEFLQILSRLVNMENMAAANTLLRMRKRDIKAALKYLIPAARIGLAKATFVMEDKYTPPESERNNDDRS